MDLLGIQVPLWLVLILAILFAYYKYMTKHFEAFKDTPGLRGPKPVPIFGNMLPVLRSGFAGYDHKLIEKYGNVVPFFLGRAPALVVADPDMLKDILIKRFDNFNERAPSVLPPPQDEMVSETKDEQWRNLRTTISPAFSAEKLKRLAQPINKCCEQLVKNLRGEGLKPVDVKDVIGSFTMDAIAATAFGMEIDSQVEQNNPFVRMAKKTFVEDFFNPWLFFSHFAPFIANFFKISFVPKDTAKFFVKTIGRIIATRTQEDKTRTDLIQLLMNANEDNAKSKNKRTLTHSEIIAQGLQFFLAGFDTVANACSEVLFCLATNPEVQDKLSEEIKKTSKSGENPGYDSLNKMKYLEMVVNETMRLYPVLARSERRATSDITIKGVFIPKGTLIQIPIDYFHHNPEIYPDPERFDPYRFTEEAKAERNPVFFQPFGMGPRQCVAMRLGKMVIKMAVVHVVRNFKVLTCAETTIPLKRSAFIGRPIGLKLKFEERT